MARYLCTENCIHAGAYRSKGTVYEFSIAPTGDAADYFDVFAGDVYTPTRFRPLIDLDGTVYYGREWWEDLRFPVAGQFLSIAGGKISYNYAEKGVDYAFNATISDADSVHVVAQLPHKRKAGSSLRAHIHWKQNQDENVAWKMTYRAYNNGELVPSEWTVVELDQLAFVYANGTLGQISYHLGDLDCADIGTSSFIEFKLSRVGAEDSYTGDALATEIDLHYVIDAPGSGKEFIK